MKRFSEFSETAIYETSLEPTEKKVTFCWGRFNPPTIGHEKVFDFAYRKAKEDNSSFYIFTSQTSDDDKNPLDYTRKIKILERYFPQYSINIVRNAEIKTLFDAVNILVDKKFTNGTMVVGQDRVDVFRKQMRDYFTDRINVEVVSAGDRSGVNPDSVESISGQMLRDFVRKGDFESFKKASPKSAKTKYVEDAYHDIRRRYGLPGDKKADPVEITTTEERERFYNGQFEAGNRILKTSTNQLGEIHSIGSNYLNIMFLGETKTKRVWPWEVTKL